MILAHTKFGEELTYRPCTGLLISQVKLRYTYCLTGLLHESNEIFVTCSKNSQMMIYYIGYIDSWLLMSDRNFLFGMLSILIVFLLIKNFIDIIIETI